MKVELELEDEKVMALVREILAFDDAYKLVYPHLMASSVLLQSMDRHKSQLRMNFQRRVWEHSNREMVAIELFNNLEFAERQGVS